MQEKIASTFGERKKTRPATVGDKPPTRPEPKVPNSVPGSARSGSSQSQRPSQGQAEGKFAKNVVNCNFKYNHVSKHFYYARRTKQLLIVASVFA